MRPLPLKWRVSLLVGGAVLLGMGFIALTAYVEMEESLARAVDRTLAAMTGSVLALLVTPPEHGATDADMRAIVGETNRRQGPAYRVWFDGASADLLASPERADLLDAASLSARRQPPPGERKFFDLGQGARRYRAVWSHEAVGQRLANVAIALPRHPSIDALEDFQGRLLYTGAAVGLLTIAVTTLLVGVGLRPIGRTARALGAVTDRNVGEAPIESGDVPAELEPFVDAVKQMLARLARALEEQKRFVSDASHELRTPLSVARSSIEAARVRDRTPGEYRRALDDVREDLERMGAMVEDLLVMARLDEGPEGRGAEEFDLATLVEDLAGAFDQGGRLVLDLRPARVRGDRAQVRRLLSNLLDNALRHGPDGGTVSVTVGTPQAGVAEVRVHDEGGAIPPEALPHLFDRFYRTDRSRTRATGGVGLGLSIARETALRHGGDISVTSTPQAGTTFSVRLPAV